MSLSLTTQLELKPGAQIVTFDSSTRGKNYRVELRDGRHFQVNEKLQHLLEALRTPLTVPALAAEFQQRTGQSVSLDQLQQLSAQLLEQGMVIEAGTESKDAGADTSHADEAAKNPTSYLGLHYRRDLLSPAMIAPFARFLQVCFNRGVAVVLLLLIVGAHVLAYREMGYPPNLDMEAISWPLLYGLFLVSVLLHELGHLAACHRWNCSHGPLGIGLYFFYPVFYVDVTAAWRLNRHQRAVVDVGGIYLQLLLAPIALLLFWATNDPTYLMLIVVMDLVILGNLEPFIKLDGYWLLSDLTGVPNLHARTGEAAKQLWAWVLWRLGRRNAASAPSGFSQWSGWVRVVIFSYIALSFVLWPIIIVAMVPMLIDAVMTYPALWQAAIVGLVEAVGQGDVGAVFAQLNTLFMPTLSLLMPIFLLKITWNRMRKNRKPKSNQPMQLQPA